MSYGGKVWGQARWEGWGRLQRASPPLQVLTPSPPADPPRGSPRPPPRPGALAATATARLETGCVALGAAPDPSAMGGCTLAFFLGVPPKSWTPALPFHTTSPKVPSRLIKLPEYPCKRRGFCPSCAGRRIAQTAAHLVEQVIPWVPTRQWVVSVPVPLRYWMAASQDLTATVHTIIRTTIGQYYVNQAVTRGRARQQVQPGSVTCIQRFGSALNVMMSS